MSLIQWVFSPNSFYSLDFDLLSFLNYSIPTKILRGTIIVGFKTIFRFRKMILVFLQNFKWISSGRFESIFRFPKNNSIPTEFYAALNIDNSVRQFPDSQIIIQCQQNFTWSIIVVEFDLLQFFEKFVVCTHLWVFCQHVESSIYQSSDACWCCST